MDKEGQSFHNTSSGIFGAGLPFFESSCGDPVIFSKRLSEDSAQGGVEFLDNRFFISLWASIILSIETLGLVMWWLL